MSDTEQKLPLEVDEVPTSDANADPQTGEEKHQPVPDISELSSEKLDHDMQVFTQNEPSQTDCNPIDADTVQPMTYEEMVQLRNIIDSMPKVKFNHVVNILRQREPSYRDCRPDEILIDFNALQQSTLLELKQYAIEYLQECKLEGGNAEARQEIRRLIELKRVQDRFERATEIENRKRVNENEQMIDFEATANPIFVDYSLGVFPSRPDVPSEIGENVPSQNE